MKNIGYQVNKILTERQIKKKDFAEKIKMSDVNLSKILHKKSIDAELLEKIAKALDVPVSYFFEESVADERGVIKVEGQNNIINNGTANNVKLLIANKDTEIEALKKQIELLEKIIKEKEQVIELLKEKLND